MGLKLDDVVVILTGEERHILGRVLEIDRGREKPYLILPETRSNLGWFRREELFKTPYRKCRR